MLKRVVGFIAVLLVCCCGGWAFGQDVSDLYALTARIGNPAFSAAWISSRTNLSVDFSETPFPFSRGNGVLPNAKREAFKTRTTGLWLTLSLPIRIGDAFGFQGEVSGLIPATNSDSDLFIDNDTSNPGFPYAYSLPVSATTRWYTLDGWLHWDITGQARLLAGLRWDYFDTRASDFPLVALLANPLLPPPFQYLVNVSVPGMEGDLTYGTFLPYVGFEAAYGTPDHRVKVRAIGLPWLKTQFDARQTQGGYSWGPLPIPNPAGSTADRYEINIGSAKGYFYELTAEYTMNGPMFGGIGIFVKWSQLHAWFDGNVDLKTSRIIPIPPFVDTGASFPAPDMSLRRDFFTVGGTYTVPFNLPL